MPLIEQDKVSSLRYLATLGSLSVDQILFVLAVTVVRLVPEMFCCISVGLWRPECQLSRFPPLLPLFRFRF